MYRFFGLFFFHLLFTGYISAQEVIDTSKVTSIDSVFKKDTLPGLDTTRKLIVPDSTRKYELKDTAVQKKFYGENFKGRTKELKEKDSLFFRWR